MKVIVVGAGGFIGAHLCNFLVNKNFKYRLFKLFPLFGIKWMLIVVNRINLNFSDKKFDFDIDKNNIQNINQIDKLQNFILNYEHILQIFQKQQTKL